MADHVTLLILFSSLFHLFMAVARLLQRPLTSGSVYLAAAFFMVSWSLLHGYANLSGEIKWAPHILYSHIPAFFLLGPVSYRWLVTLVGEKAGMRGFLLECIPAAAATAFLTPVFLLPAEQKLALAASFVTTGNVPPQGQGIFGAGLALYMVYLVRSAVILRPYMTLDNLRKEKSAVAAAVVLAYAALLTVTVGFSIFLHRSWFPFAMYGLSLFAPGLFLLEARFPDLLPQFQRVVERGK
ncbi:MAG: hypothetical protein HY042_01375, partial [Spirochaetia bacterium]|nr:hypothetical protein [Spirochaetia bacterium]